jgi:hypothetical protein
MSNCSGEGHVEPTATYPKPSSKPVKGVNQMVSIVSG